MGTKSKKIDPKKGKKAKKSKGVPPMSQMLESLVKKDKPVSASEPNKGFKIMQEGEGWRVEKNLTSKAKFVVINPNNRFELSTFAQVLKLPGPTFPLKKVLERGLSISSRLSNESDYSASARQLKEYVDAELAKTRVRVVSAVNDTGVIQFHDLAVYFQPGIEVYVERDGLVYGARISDIHEQMFWGNFSSSMFFSLETIEMVGSMILPRKHEIRVKRYDGAISLSDIPFSILTEEQKAKFTERGRMFRDLVVDGKPKYLTYTGELTERGWMWNRSYRATGRVVIHGQGFAEYGDLDKLDSFRGEIRSCDGDRKSIDLTDEVLWMCSPVVYGFSFYCKHWGEMKLDGLKKVEFRKDAIDKLVLDPETKKLILALVKNNAGGFTDLVDGKGGGTIFLLHGTPGTGKTLTAEAVAETLERPLYTMSVGELGTNPQDVEENLRKILEMAGIWDAVVLLDEADVFLESRTSGDVQRNAMVSVFLRLLEYHQGVLFLTSNRIADFDPAFHSRISITLHYDKMSAETRMVVWQNLMDAAGLKGLDSTEMALLAEINGRQIKNVIRAAISLAKSEGKPVDKSHIEQCLKLTNNVNKPADKKSKK